MRDVFVLPTFTIEEEKEEDMVSWLRFRCLGSPNRFRTNLDNEGLTSCHHPATANAQCAQIQKSTCRTSRPSLP
jgi:hypothetical protein